MTAQEALDRVLGSDDEEDCEAVVMLPPNDGQNSEEESGDEDEGNINHLHRNQLLSEVELVTSEDHQDKADANTQSGKKRKISCQWTKKDSNNRMVVNNEMIEENQNELNECEKPVDFFRLFFDSKLIESILIETERYTNESFTADQIYAVLGILIISGVLGYPRRRLYWSKSDLLRNKIISESMSQKEFEKLFSRLHFCNNDDAKYHPEDKFFKVNILLKSLNENFLKYGPATEYFSVDECIVPYFGRHSSKQFIRGKPIRFGFKAWVIASQRGYVYQFSPYPGAAEKPTPEHDLGPSANVVIYLMKVIQKRFMDTQLHVTMDNYFTSISLLRYLNELNIKATGTIRRPRIPNAPSNMSELDGKERGSCDSW